MLRRLYTLADILVILTLLLAPFISAQFGFLRVLRAMRLVHSYHVLRDLRRETAVFRRNEELIVACVNLAVFKIGSAHVRTTVTNAHLVCRLQLEKKQSH